MSKYQRVSSSDTMCALKGATIHWQQGEFFKAKEMSPLFLNEFNRRGRVPKFLAITAQCQFGNNVLIHDDRNIIIMFTKSAVMPCQ
jgi:hypothetical protein